jgi:ABC-type thiamine transport system substrate-binding protein
VTFSVACEKLALKIVIVLQESFERHSGRENMVADQVEHKSQVAASFHQLQDGLFLFRNLRSVSVGKESPKKCNTIPFAEIPNSDTM